jgi:hypothetical protein
MNDMVELKVIIDDHMNKMFKDVNKQYKLSYGDISPLQTVMLGKIKICKGEA